ncbi:MAG: MetQ/NlpA family ABC transporter substrate-binding protein [Chlamydiae bacterium]|nr:MetQ/NlpA family ABC transporter substrate-binding protein [Chlamydiota bacterium]
MYRNIIISFALLILASCSSTSHQGRLTIQASSTPQAEILQQVVEDLAQEGITLNILIIDDYNLPNRALAEQEIDANFFQHKPFLEEQIEQFHYNLTSLVEVHIEPMGLYARKQVPLPEGAKISLPNDPTNETRALLLLEQAGLIQVTHDKTSLTPNDVIFNPKHLRFYEVDAALLTRTLEDVEAAVIPTNYALLANLVPSRDALFLEDRSSKYANLIAVRKEDENKPEFLLLKKHMQSEKMRNFIQQHYQGAVLPAD